MSKLGDIFFRFFRMPWPRARRILRVGISADFRLAEDVGRDMVGIDQHVDDLVVALASLEQYVDHN